MTAATGATPRQASYIESLLHDRAFPTNPDVSAEDVLVEAGVTVDAYLANIGDRRQASSVIDTLLSYPRVAAPAARAQAADAAAGTADPAPASRRGSAEPPEGIHYVGPDDGSGTVYKVQVAVHGSGKKYAKRLVVSGPGQASWEYDGRSSFRLLSDETLLDLDRARKFGLTYGVCMVCGRTLTDETSIERGIGPVCEGRLR